jgi:hypothetical protein
MMDRPNRPEAEEVEMIGEDEQERIIEEFRKKQERVEKFFSQVLFLLASPIFVFFLVHCYLQIISPWCV